jgi:hypothetical protein
VYGNVIAYRGEKKKEMYREKIYRVKKGRE